MTQSAPWFGPYVAPLLAVAAATVDEDGTLIEANRGFLRLIMSEQGPATGRRVARFFRQPDFATLVGAAAGADGKVYHGLLTIDDDAGRTRSLRTRVWRTGKRLRILAEYEIEELEGLYDKVLELNRDYAAAQLRLAQTNLQLQQREAQILEASLTDPLTGVGNRRRLNQALAAEVGRVERTGEALCGFIADLDHFKRINDAYGHEAGDDVLATFGGLLRRETRATDIVARFGGEEFVVLMPHTHLEMALVIAERIRTALAAIHVAPLRHPVTASFGIAGLRPHENGDAFLQRIDKALYEAKRSGRNRVVTG